MRDMIVSQGTLSRRPSRQQPTSCEHDNAQENPLGERVHASRVRKVLWWSAFVFIILALLFFGAHTVALFAAGQGLAILFFD